MSRSDHTNPGTRTPARRLRTTWRRRRNMLIDALGLLVRVLDRAHRECLPSSEVDTSLANLRQRAVRLLLDIAFFSTIARQELDPISETADRTTDLKRQRQHAESDQSAPPSSGGLEADEPPQIWRHPFLEDGNDWFKLLLKNNDPDHRILHLVIQAVDETVARNHPFSEAEWLGTIYEHVIDGTIHRAQEPLVELEDGEACRPVPLAELELELKTKGDSFATRSGDVSSEEDSVLWRDSDSFWNAEGDRELIRRVGPFLDRIRRDGLGRPLIVPAGSAYVTTGEIRRAQGSHYTPRELTEPIIRETLEPLVYHGPSQGLPRERWRLKSPSDLLRLKVCDPSCGSGAFLIEACRFLADRLIESLHKCKEEDGDAKELHSTSPRDRLSFDLSQARRLVATRCLYGVDVDPIAVRIARLSLWLLIQDPSQPLTLMDHTIRQGDSLVGPTTWSDREACPVHGFNSGLSRLRPFDWAQEFPEVFTASKGFDAVVGNPPFMGGQKITGRFCKAYRETLIHCLAGGRRGSADLCAYFVLRLRDLVRPGGQVGLVATNTIAQGDTREVGLDQLLDAGWVIRRAVSSRRWPGVAGLEVVRLWMSRGAWNGPIVLDDQPVTGISAGLYACDLRASPPRRLNANRGRSFQGSIVLGRGFILSPEEAAALMARDPRNQEVLCPYLSGRDLNNRHDRMPGRWVINFRDWPEARAASYPDCHRIVVHRVKPERDRSNRRVYRERWWQYAEKRPELLRILARMSRVLVGVLHTHHWAVHFCPTQWVFSHGLVVFAHDDFATFALLSSSLHEEWARRYSGTLGRALRYAPSDCFETFPFPPVCDRWRSLLAVVGQQEDTLREQALRERGQGLTATLNRLHDPKEHAAVLVAWRDLAVERDRAVASAYGWDDLKLGHGFHPTPRGLRFLPSESARTELLERLLRLNHDQARKEIEAGLDDQQPNPWDVRS